MEHTTNYAVVPLDRVQQFEEAHLTDLDTQIQIIFKTNMDEEAKTKYYTKVL